MCSMTGDEGYPEIMTSRLQNLEKGLVAAGAALLTPPSATDELLSLLDKAEYVLSKVGQDGPEYIQAALIPLIMALANKSLQSHSDLNVKVSVVSCIAELCRISAPDELYPEEMMMEIFKLFVVAFEKLSHTSGRCYMKAVNILKNIAMIKLCNVLLDLECEALVIEIFQQFLGIISFNNAHAISGYMEDIMTLLIEGSEDISLELLRPLLASARRENENGHSAKLGVMVLRKCAVKVKPYLQEAVKILSLDLDDYDETVRSICEGEYDRDNVEGKAVALNDNHLVEGVPANTHSLGDGNDCRNRNNMPKEDNALGTLEKCCDQPEQLKGPEEELDLESENSPLVGDDHPEDETAAVAGKKALEESTLALVVVPTSINAVVEGDTRIINEAEAKQEQLLCQLDGIKQAIDSSTSGKQKTTADIGSEVSENQSALRSIGNELIGSRIKVYWPLDKRFYTGVVSAFDPLKMEHTVLYVDGGEEHLNLTTERWELLDKKRKADVQGPNVKKRKADVQGPFPRSVIRKKQKKAKREAASSTS